MVLMKVVKEFLQKGKLLSPDIVDEVGGLEDGEREELIKESALVVGKRELDKLKKPGIKIVREDEEDRDEIHVSDFTEFYLNRFEFLKKEVKGRLDDENISSINSLSSGPSSVIGMVRDLRDGETVVEDKTGELVLKTNETFVEDEVVGVKGRVIKNEDVVMDPKKVVRPDIPLGKEVRSLDEELTALFVSDAEGSKKVIEEEEPDYVFCASELDGDRDIVHISDEPGELSDPDPVRCMLGEMLILLHTGDSVDKIQDKLDLDRRDAMVALMKRRHLDPQEMHSLNDRYLLKNVPDIVHVSGEEKVMTNYKGVTLLSSTDDTAFLVNLGTREVEEVELK